jgi:hypothetical protein
MVLTARRSDEKVTQKCLLKLEAKKVGIRLVAYSVDVV